MAKAKKSSGKPNFDFKKFFLEKGDRVALIVAGVGLALLALLGLKAGAAGPGRDFVRELQSGKSNIETRLQASGDEVPATQISGETNVYKVVKSTDFPVSSELFDLADKKTEKRAQPKVLSITQGQAQFYYGATRIYRIAGDKVAVVVGRTPPKNDTNAMNLRKRNRPGGAGQPPGGGAPGGGSAPGGGGAPGGGAPGGGNPPGGFTAPGGGGSRGGGGNQGQRTLDAEIDFVPIEQIDKYQTAHDLQPLRAVLVQAAVPYRDQVQNYINALRMPSAEALEASGDVPTYNGFVVERQELEADGVTVRQDWTPFDYLGTFKELHRVVVEYEREDERVAALIPDNIHRLYLRRPRLTRGAYPRMAMASIDEALAEQQKSGPPKSLGNKAKKVLNEDDPFNFQDVTPGGPGMGGPGLGGPGGSGALSGMQPPIIPGRGGEGRGPGGVGVTAQPRKNNTSKVWLLQFIDPTVQPNRAYKYRIKLRLQNPNYGKPDLVSAPSFAAIQELDGDWSEPTNPVVVPEDEFLYAHGTASASKSEYGNSTYDKTILRFHVWKDAIRINKDSTGTVPVGDWVCTDVDSYRGQYVHESRKTKLPLWSMVLDNYIFRQPISRTAGMTIRNMRNLETVDVDFTPQTPVLLVDFEGGQGQYRFPGMRNAVQDECNQEILLVTDDGKAMTVTARNTRDDGRDAERIQREEEWKRWLDEVKRNTESAPAGNTGRPPGGGP